MQSTVYRSIFNSVSNSNFNTLLINVCLPTDYGNFDSYNAYVEYFGELEGFIASQSFIICGDFDIDFSKNNHNCQQLKMFMSNYGLVSDDLL